MAHHIPLSHAGFRAKFIYNNMMYALAAKVVEVLTGSSWEERIRERFFDLLGMEDASFLPEELDDSPNIAKPHMLVNGTPVEMDMQLNRSVVFLKKMKQILISQSSGYDIFLRKESNIFI
jgi:CubicO group peptidase (beta-lactamase class C family)